MLNMQDNYLIRIKNLSVDSGGTSILENIELFIIKGMLMNIFGPNGGGKTMLLSTILGLNKIFTGHINISKGVSFSYMPQSLIIPRYIPILTKDFMLLYTNNIDYSICEKLNIMHKLNSGLHESSGGEMRKIIFASIVMCQSDLIILDEPEENLDFKSKIEMYNILRNEVKKNRSVLVVSHDPRISTIYSDHVIYLKKKMHYSGKSESIDLHSFGYHGSPDVSDLKLDSHHNGRKIPS